ncbi:MAG: serine/threonine-protein kinase [Rubripirellula sp.]|nr:serine/threonine-protein kinase [Rubripirellula sp.]
MPTEQMIQESMRFIDKCVELDLVSKSDADNLRGAVGEEGHFVEQNALQRGLLTASDIEIVQSLLRPFDVVTGYEILDFVGRGGMGVVYRARQLDLDRIVALKTVLISSVGDPTTVARFELEAKALARLQHPNIVQALNFGKHEGRFYFSMEFVSGRTCEQLVTSGIGLPNQQAWQIVRQVASGLLHASRQGLIHRDIKPANLILMRAPEGSVGTTVNHGIAKITDFGLAMFTDKSQQEMRLTTGDKIIGSPAFMSPEQFTGGELDFRTDMYSLGATAWNLLFGEIPFRGGNVGALYKQKLNPSMIAQNLTCSLPENQWQLLMGLLDPDRERRPSSYEMLIDAIDQLEVSDPMVATAEMSIDSVVAGISSISEETTVTGKRVHTDQAISTYATTVEYSHQGAELPGQDPLDDVPSSGTSVTVLRRLVGLLALVCLVYGFAFWGGWFRAVPRGPRELKRVIQSLPLFDGVTLTRWDTDGTMVGAWNTVEAPDSSTAIACTTGQGGLTRQLPFVDFSRISLFVWVQDGAGVVDIDFAIDVENLRQERGTLRFDGTSVQLGTKRDDFGSVSVINESPLPDGFAERFHVVHIERQKEDWYVFLEQQLVGTVPLGKLTGDNAFRVVVHGNGLGGETGPHVFFSDVQLSRLAEE